MADTLYKSENEIADLVGIDRRTWPHITMVWERQGFPPIDPQIGKRYWPAVRAFLDRRNGVMQSAAPTFAPDGEETPDNVRGGQSTRARATAPAP